MRYWVLGQAAPGMALSAIERDSDKPSSRASGRTICKSRSNYAEPDATRPSRVEVAGAGAEIRLVIDSLTTLQP